MPGRVSLVIFPSARAPALAAAFGSIFATCGCRCGAPTPAPSASASASASAAPKPEPPPPRCRSVEAGGLRMELGAPPPAASGEEGDDAIGLPFSPEIGGAMPLGDGFLVGVLEPSKEGTNAAL